MSQHKRIILVSAMGTSPAVLTNTVWGLAHQKHSIVPDEIVVFITKSGKELLIQKLFDEGVWNEMRSNLKREKIEIDGKLVFGETSIRVIPDAEGNEIEDLRTGDDNLRAADFMLSQLRQYTEDSETELHVSIAGGRTTMSALLFSCMTLLGRECDKVYHVLLPQDLEQGATPEFFYPEPGKTFVSKGTTKKLKAKQISTELFEVPFVRMRGWYQEKFKAIPPNYRTLVSKIQTVAPRAIAYPEMSIDIQSGSVTINGKSVTMSRTCFALLVVIASGCPVRDLHERLKILHASKSKMRCDWLDTFRKGARFNEHSERDDLFKTMSDLRKRLSAVGFVGVESLIPKRDRPITFPLARIKWRGKEYLADICGYPILVGDQSAVIPYAASKEN